MNCEETAALVPARNKQVEEDLWQRHKAERGVWTEAMLMALKGIPLRPWLKNGSGEDADPPGSRRAAFHGRTIRRHGPVFNRACSIFWQPDGSSGFNPKFGS